MKEEYLNKKVIIPAYFVGVLYIVSSIILLAVSENTGAKEPDYKGLSILLALFGWLELVGITIFTVVMARKVKKLSLSHSVK
ncbi:hypothetical protein ACQUEN_01735 [Lactococcus taiwanensis]|jgi:hypothetical protein|uniref:hypothetical protein n=1 Tax=Lactococcus taiwanensis TaxID=1151742 RepID=UPI001963D0A8|nr:hypothetical protein [Lactococcus taiwanensis]QRZ11802.1 hypothetical protein JVB21_03925 [Lactococcus taiwanensis]